MAIKERREREKREHRQRILDAASAIIREEGFAALSMRKLAERIEYSPAAIYLVFKNREEIAQELSEQGFGELLDALTKAVASKRSAEALHALGAAYIAFGLEHPEIYRLIFMGDSDYMKAAYAAHSLDTAAVKTYDVLLELARQLQEGKAESEVAAVAEMIWCALHGIVSLHITCAAFLSASPQSLAKLVTQTLATGFGCTLVEGQGEH